MEIVTKSIFTYIDLAMDNFKISLEVREKYLVWLCDYLDVPSEHKKRWCKIGRGIDYYTFKDWVSKENRFSKSQTDWPKRSFKVKSHYHTIESVLEELDKNSYEEKLQFYHALSLLVLVDKKNLMPRVEFIKWTADALFLDEDDCRIIREHVIEEFDLSFDVENLDIHDKEDIFLSGVKMAYISGDIIDNKEIEFLNSLKCKLGNNFINSEDKYFLEYYSESFSKNKYHSTLSMHKMASVLLNIINSDNNIDKREGTWFKKNFSGLDHNLLSDLLLNNITKVIDAMSDEDKVLCYVLGLELSLRDDVIHKNEVFWLDYIFDSISKNFTMDRELSFVYFEAFGRNIGHVSRNLKLFLRVSNFFSLDIEKDFSRWRVFAEFSSKHSVHNAISKILFEDEYSLSTEELTQELISLSFSLYSRPHLNHLFGGFNAKVNECISTGPNERYAEMLICEILKISVLDNKIDNLEDDYLRELQHRFGLDEKQLHKVVFMTAFLVGEKVELSPRVNYSYL